MPNPCPKSDCTATGPHQHPMLGEGLWDPPVREIARTGQMEKLEVSVEKIPCRCPRCGAAFEGVAFIPMRPGETERVRPCDSCADKAEQACLERTPKLAIVKLDRPEPVLKAPRVIGQRELAPGDR